MGTGGGQPTDVAPLIPLLLRLKVRALLAQGEFYGESAAAKDGCYALRRVLPAVRVRETMIVPVTPSGRDQARTWRELYNAEEQWLDWALPLAGLPGREQIFGR
jgi:hypothetical protein